MEERELGPVFLLRSFSLHFLLMFILQKGRMCKGLSKAFAAFSPPLPYMNGAVKITFQGHGFSERDLREFLSISGKI